MVKKSHPPQPLQETALPVPLEEMGEDAWIDVIRKMDEVYSELLQHEVALEEKNMELEETHQFMFSVLTSMSDIVIVCDRFGRVEDVNSAMARLVGHQEEDLRGMPFIDLLADEDSRMTVALFPTCLRDGNVHDCEVVLRGPDGGEVPVSLNCTPRYGMQGTQVGMVIVGRPVGELRRAYQSLREAHDQLKQAQQQLIQSEKMASLGRLVAGVAHELNNPISFVLGNVHALKRYAGRLKPYLDAVHQGNREQREQLRQELRIDRILSDLDPLIDGTIEGAERTRDIVDGLKRFSALDKEEAVVFNLAEVVEKAVHWVSKAGPTRFQVENKLPRELPVSGNPNQMQQVVINLVQNALDATRGEESPALEISGGIENGRVEARFHDNGRGIPAENLTRVFDPFFTTKPVGKGTGLGLSISYGIVEHHGGKLSADNHSEGGAVFTLSLPLAKA